jgi:hypothetical protein
MTSNQTPNNQIINVNDMSGESMSVRLYRSLNLKRGLMLVHQRNLLRITSNQGPAS